MRILGLDYGSKTVGVAVSDPLGLTAQRLETIWRKQENKLRRTFARVEELVKEYEVEKIVLGYPKNMNNTVGERAEKALEFGEMLKKRTGLEVIMWDERLTTVSACNRRHSRYCTDDSQNPEDAVFPFVLFFFFMEQLIQTGSVHKIFHFAECVLAHHIKLVHTSTSFPVLSF